jgi:hypothetical protein
LAQQSWNRLAWEFLRRNRSYVEDWKHLAVRHNPDMAMLTGMASTDVTPEILAVIDVACTWGLLWLADPALDCRTARVFWQSDVSPLIVSLSLMPKRSVSASFLTNLNLDMLREVSFQVDEGNYYLFKGVFQDFQINVINSIDTLNAADMAFHFTADRSIDAQLFALKKFLTFLSGRTVDQRGAHPSGAKLQRCRQLIALDANMAGASYRDIAILLYGKEAVSSNWHSGHLKDRVRYAVREGKRLMNGGYRELLK